MAQVKTAIVIGGGIAGPVAAMALQKAGIEARVYESYPATADGIGGMLMVQPNGLNALGVIGLQDAVSAIGQPIARSVIADGRGRELMELPSLPGLPASQLMWRSNVYRAIRQAALERGIRIEHGKRLVAASEDDSAVTAVFADGTTATADVLIGADGIRSTVRKLIDPQAPEPRCDGLLGFGGDADLELSGRTDEFHFVFGKKAFLGWWRQPNGRAAWFSNLAHKEYLSKAEANEVPAGEWLAQLREVYAGDSPAEELLRSTRPENLQVFGSTDMLPEVPRWHSARMVLVGDSAHAPNHSSGQGVSLAVESAIELARYLRDVEHPSQAFAVYEQLRRPRVTRIAEQANRTNQRKAAGPIASAVMGLFMRVATKTFLTPEKMFGWIQGYRITWDAPLTSPARPDLGTGVRLRDGCRRRGSGAAASPLEAEVAGRARSLDEPLTG